MILDIRKSVIKIKLRSFYTVMVFVLSISLIIFTRIYGKERAGIDKYELSIILASIYLVIVVLKTLRNYYYIFYNDEKDKIILRYFSLSVFIDKKNSIEIVKKDFAGYKIDKFLFGFRENITLFQKTPRGAAKYPSVSLTALSKTEKRKLIHSLQQYGKQIDKTNY